MAQTSKYDNARRDQITRIRKLANNSIVTIWTAGFSAVMVLTAYFLFFSEDSWAEKRSETIRGSAKLTDELLFTDKTTLVNIGLKMQAIQEEADGELGSGGTISINKIIHDQKLNKIKKPVKPELVAKEIKPGFTIKAVPK